MSCVANKNKVKTNRSLSSCAQAATKSESRSKFNVGSTRSFLQMQCIYFNLLWHKEKQKKKEGANEQKCKTIVICLYKRHRPLEWVSARYWAALTLNHTHTMQICKCVAHAPSCLLVASHLLCVHVVCARCVSECGACNPLRTSEREIEWERECALLPETKWNWNANEMKSSQSKNAKPTNEMKK